MSGDGSRRAKFQTPTGRRVRVVLDGRTAPKPAFYGDLPADAPPAPSDALGAGGCAAS
jgi:hypothetical protein